tara:strand:- start:100 stop:288 length:189 start_codon:yes stop_codon:yes gene_type:complete
MLHLVEDRMDDISMVVMCYASDIIEYDRRTLGLSNELINHSHEIRYQQYREKAFMKIKLELT